MSYAIRRILPVCAALLLHIAVLAAQPQTKSRFDLTAQPMAKALNAFAIQAGVNIYFDPPSVEGLQSPSLKAELTASDALARLLAGTQLQAIYVDENTIRVVPMTAAARKSVATAEPGAATAGNTASAMRLARAGEDETPKKRPNEPAEENKETRGIPEILVKGRRSSNTDIRRTEDDVQPYVVFDAEDIQRSMAGNLEDFFMSRLPMNAASGTNARSATDPLAYTYGNQSAINLRGLGANQTLILVNGRRLPGAYDGIDLRQPDINGIALSSVERIEVLPSTAGGIYGGGATGGVINIVLKSDYRGLDLRAVYNNTFDTDAGERRLEANAGFTLEGGRTQLTFSASHNDANLIQVDDRDFNARGRELLRQHNAAGLGNPPPGATSNFRSSNGQVLTLKFNGQSLGFNFGSVPYGYAGPLSDHGLGLAAGAGHYNLDLPSGPAGKDAALLTQPTQSSVSMNLRRTFTPWLDVFVDGSYFENVGSLRYSNFPRTNITLPIAAPNNPFNQPLVVRFTAADYDVGAVVPTRSSTLSGTIGARFQLPHEWTTQLEYGWSRSRNKYATAAQVLTTAGKSALANGNLDIMRDVLAHPLDYAPYLFSPMPNNYLLEPNETILKTGTARLAGSVFSLPAGHVVLSGLIERREEDPQHAITVSYPAPNTGLYLYSPPLGQTTDSAYVEATAPLVSSANARPWVRALDLQASYRRDRTATQALKDGNDSILVVPSPKGPFPDVPYTVNRVEANQYTLGLRYQPIEALALRASYGVGILAPSLGQLAPVLVPDTPLGLFGIVDPKRGFNPPEGTQQVYFTGDPNLRPENSRSWSAGAIFTPAALPGLRVSLDYTRIRKTDEITELDFQVLVDLEDSFPGRVVRAQLTDADRDLGYTGGEITELHAGAVNIAHTQLEAYDLQADYEWRTDRGTFRANLITTYSPYYRRQILAGSDLLDAVSYSGGPLEWRGNGGLTWERNGWTAGWNMQYYAPYFVYAVDATPAIRDRLKLNQGSGGRIPSQSYHDLFIKYRFDGTASYGHGALANSELMFGINNVLNTSPPILATNNWVGGGYSTYGDPRLRRYSISLRKSFQ